MAKTAQSAGDDEPYVLLADAAIAALAAADESAPGLEADARAYLAANGISSSATLAAFGVGSVGPAELAAFGLTGRRAPRGGITIPTRDPRAPERVLGLIKLTAAQHKHAFATPPAGVAGPPTLRDAARVVLAATPLLALRLHEDGVAAVGLVEDPTVLLPLSGWLAGRDVVLAAHRQADLDAMRAALGPRGSSVPGVVVSMARGIYSGDARRLLGITQVDEEPPPPITPRLLTDLHAFARGRVEAGEARDALASFGLDAPDLVNSYAVGYLPADYASALPRDAQRALVGRRCGNALLIPAFNGDGVIVDAIVARAHASVSPVVTFWPEPRGVFAPTVARGYGELIVTDGLRSLGNLFREGYRNVLLLRGAADVRANAPALRSCGIERITVSAARDADALTAALLAAGLNVLVPTRADPVGALAPSTHAATAAEGRAPTPHKLVNVAPEQVALPATAAMTAAASTGGGGIDEAASSIALVEEDRQNETAIFQAGPFRYAVELREDGDTRRRIVVRSNGQSAQDRFDLANEAQRDRYAGNAARRLSVSTSIIAAHLSALLAAVQQLEDQRDQAPAVEVSADDRTLGLALLDAPDLLDRVAADLTALGWIGDERAKRVLYLASVSRLLPHPVWAAYQAGGGAAPWKALACIAALTPTESQTIFHRLTDASITHADRAILRHRLLIVDQAETLRPEAALALRVLRERGGIGWAMTGTGASIGEARGPVAVLAATAGALDPRCRDAFLTISVDESPRQTAAIQADQRRLLALGTAAPAPSVLRRHHAAQRLLQRLPVRIPFAERIIFPASCVRHREEQAWFLGLVAASALIHQRQRVREGGAIIASEDDFHLVVGCTSGLLGAESGSISVHARRLLSGLYENRLAHFTTADLPNVVSGDWTRYAFRAALLDLLDFGHIEAGESRRGKLREFRLVVRPGGVATLGPGIRLRPRDAQSISDAEAGVMEILAKDGDTGVANFARRESGS